VLNTYPAKIAFLTIHPIGIFETTSTLKTNLLTNTTGKALLGRKPDLRLRILGLRVMTPKTS
jgi:hypothetical protein